MACDHKLTFARPGEKGTWCADCGEKVYEAHDRPCGQCVHFKDAGGGSVSMCMRHHVAVASSMKVLYRIGAAAQDGGLCFEPAEKTESHPIVAAHAPADAESLANP